MENRCSKLIIKILKKHTWTTFLFLFLLISKRCLSIKYHPHSHDIQSLLKVRQQKWGCDTTWLCRFAYVFIHRRNGCIKNQGGRKESLLRSTSLIRCLQRIRFSYHDILCILSNRENLNSNIYQWYCNLLNSFYDENECNLIFLYLVKIQTSWWYIFQN